MTHTHPRKAGWRCRQWELRAQGTGLNQLGTLSWGLKSGHGGEGLRAPEACARDGTWRGPSAFQLDPPVACVQGVPRGRLRQGAP